MIRVCMACGKRTLVHPYLDSSETHGVCAGMCHSVYVAWSVMLDGSGLSLPELYVRTLAQGGAAASVEEKDAPRASWVPLMPTT